MAYELTVAAELAAVQAALGLAANSPERALYNIGGVPGIAARRLIADAKSGAARRKLYIASDSTGVTGTLAQRWPTQLRTLLEAAGVPCRADYWNFGDGGNYPSGTNPKLTYSGLAGNNYTMMVLTGAATVNLLPEKTGDTVVVKYFDPGAGNNFRFKVGAAGAWTNVTGIGGNVIRSATATGTAGSLDVTIEQTAGTFICIHSAHFYDSAVNDLQIMNASVSGTSSYNDWDNETQYAKGAGMKAWLAAGDHLIAALGINDQNNNVSLANFTTSIALIDAHMTTIGAGMSWVGYWPISSANGNPQQAWNDAILAQAITSGRRMLSMFERWGKTHAIALAAGFKGDSLHQTSTTGNADMARAVSELLLA